MPVADMIESGGIDNFVRDFRTCRDSGRNINCQDYAIERAQARHPTESRASINALAVQGRAAVDEGNAANRSGPGREVRPGGGYDPADIQRRGGNGNPIVYRYGVTVSGVVGGGRNAGTAFSYRIFIDSNLPLTTSQIRDEAAAQVAQIAAQLDQDYDRLGGGSLPTQLDTRIDSAHRYRS